MVILCFVYDDGSTDIQIEFLHSISPVADTQFHGNKRYGSAFVCSEERERCCPTGRQAHGL